MAEDTGRSAAHCGRCGHEVDIVLVIEPDHEVHRRLARIERALGIIHTEQEHDMAELDDRLAEIAADEDAEHAQLARLIQDFETAPGADLSDAQRQVLDQIKSHIVGDTAAIVGADPEAPAEPAPGGDVPPVDGGTEPAPAETPSE